MCVNFNYNNRQFVADMIPQTLEIVTFTGVSALLGDDSVVVAHFDKGFHVEGCNLSDEDTFTVLDSDYVALSDQTTSMQNGTLYIRAPVSRVGQEIRLAMRIRNEPEINLDSSIFRARVYGVAALTKDQFVMRNTDSIGFTTAYNVPYCVLHVCC